MGVLVDIEASRLYVPKGRVSATLDAVRSFAQSKSKLFFSEQEEKAASTAHNVDDAFRAAGFRIRMNDEGALVGIEYVADKLPRDSDWLDVKQFFSAFAKSVRGGSFVRFSEEGGCLHTFRFAKGKVTYTTKVERRRASASAKSPSDRAWKLHDLGRHDEAIAVMDRAIARHPQDAKLLEQKAFGLYWKTERYEEAAEAVERALRIDVSSAGAWNLYGTICSALNRVDEAIAAYQRAIRLEPEDPTYHQNLASTFAENADRPEEALVSIDRALALRDWDPALIALRCRYLYYLDRYEEAVARGRGATDVEDLSMVLGLSNQELARYDDARAQFEKAVAEEREPRTLLALADALTGLGKSSAARALRVEALALVETAISEDPNAIEHRTMKATCLCDLGRAKDALASATEALAIDPKSASAERSMARALLSLDRPADALKATDRAIALDARNAYAHFHRATALAELGRDDEAAASLRRATTISRHLALLAAAHPKLAELDRHSSRSSRSRSPPRSGRR